MLGTLQIRTLYRSMYNGYAINIRVNSLQHPPAVAVQTLLVDQLRPADALDPLLELF